MNKKSRRVSLKHRKRRERLKAKRGPANKPAPKAKSAAGGGRK